MLGNYPLKSVLCLLLALCFHVSAASFVWSTVNSGHKYVLADFWDDVSKQEGEGNLQCQELCENKPSCTAVTIITEVATATADTCMLVFPDNYPDATEKFATIPSEGGRSFYILERGVPGSCFHGDGSLLLKSGNTKKFSELSLGDEIKTSNGLGGFTYSSILTLPHKNNTEPALFVTLITESGKKLDLTSDHFIPKCDQTQVTAAELVVGDCLLTIDGKETLVEVSSEAKNGVFTAITKDKYIVVDGVVASPFSKNTDPMKPELDYEKYRMELEEKRARRVSAQVSELQKKAVGHTSN